MSVYSTVVKYLFGNPQHFPGWISRTIIVTGLLVLLICRTMLPAENLPPPMNDQSFENILFKSSIGIMLLTLWTWFWLFSAYGRGLRVGAFVGGIVLVIALFALIRLKDVSGTLELSFEPRWWTRADRRLGKVITEKQNQAIDLATKDADAFPQFLGPDRNCWIPDPGLAHDWEAQPPKLLWKQPIGAGWAAFSAINGHAITMEQRGEEEWTSCYRIRDGEPVWGQANQARHQNVLGGIGPRATPTIAGGRVYTVGATGIVQCLDAAGKPIWQVDLLNRYAMTQAVAEVEVMWGWAGSPLIVDDMVIVAAGGRTDDASGSTPKSLIALKADTGKVVWEAGDDQISYASPVLTTLAGQRQIVSVNEKTVSGHNPKTGKQLWSHPWPGDSSTNATASQPVPIGSNRLLLTKGYGGGSEMIELSKEGSAFQVQSIWSERRNLQTKFTNVTIMGDYAYGLCDGILECVELETGERQWKDRRGDYGHGQILGVGKLILVVGEDGRVTLVEANPEELVELTSFQAIEGKTWNNPCLYGKLLLVRNSEQAACYELP